MNLLHHSLRLLLTVIILSFAGIFSANASTGHTVSAQEQILRQHLDSLQSVTNAADSITIIFDIFDILPQSARHDMGNTLYKLVKQHSGNTGALNVLRLLAIIYSDNSDALQAILEEAETLPESDEKKESLVFIRIYLTKKQAQTEPLSVRKEKLADMISPNLPQITPENFYDNLLRLLTICVYTRQITEGSMLNEQLHNLDRALLNHQQLRTYGIRRQYAEMKADIFTNNDDPAGAVQADKELLAIVDDMEREFVEQARQHLALHWFRYRAYSRLLLNMRATTMDEAEKYYRAINELADSIPEVRAAYNEHHYPDIYYLLKNKRYSEALPMIRRELETEDDIKQRRYLLRHMIDASIATKDDHTLLQSLKEYIPLLDLYIKDKATESNNELEVIYKVGRMRKQAIEDEIEARRETGRHHTILIICMTALIAMTIAAIVVLLILSLRLIRTQRKLRLINKKLLSRRDELKAGSEELVRAIEKAQNVEKGKESFIRYISSTISLPLNSIMEYSSMIINSSNRKKRRFLQRFADVVQDNSERLKQISAQLLIWSKGNDSDSPLKENTKTHKDDL